MISVEIKLLKDLDWEDIIIYMISPVQIWASPITHPRLMLEEQEAGRLL